jgi:hypothetical protein
MIVDARRVLCGRWLGFARGTERKEERPEIIAVPVLQKGGRRCQKVAASLTHDGEKALEKLVAMAKHPPVAACNPHRNDTRDGSEVMRQRPYITPI